ncbi:MAG: lipoyl(octanoyl) transferase LipB [Acidobacteriota bacterium]|nr:lipoyl(octanoyl) transferase LipB [Acidobacteriota bacterium]
MHKLGVQDLRLMRWEDAAGLQQRLVAERKKGLICDRLLFVEHPHVITMGRNAHGENLLAREDVLGRAGVSVHETNRGGDVTYHGPGQVVGYPILDLNEWKRDVHLYVRALEEVVIRTLGEFGIGAERVQGMTGVWTGGAKIAAIGVHLSRWVTSHGFALNVDTDLSYFEYIVPCGLRKPVTSMRVLGVSASREQVLDRLSRNFSEVFDRERVIYGRCDAADGREYRRGNADEVAQEAGRHRGTGRAAI